MKDIHTLASELWTASVPPPTPVKHRATSYYAGVADRWVMDCTCGWHEVDCDWDTTREDVRRRLAVHLATHSEAAGGQS